MGLGARGWLLRVWEPLGGIGFALSERKHFSGCTDYDRQIIQAGFSRRCEMLCLIYT